ncbi:winged helix-turn-helix domain-containing protein [Curvibacter sp. APW13]|uniref:winged helix-turn-helix domain-containing protein n=1 Tax=Curvibacter sp. APW13 TaxID=3077236 RepID=UPI0028DF4F27|nr:winged helix-turn-helix domain-containing protein [Curvibacter sp. APW13]MDT8990488.1 winged helix-turn-helix domain-containing protein [Curvibacter sp. APW13]
MGCSILLVEDDPAIARTVAYSLEREGWHVVHSLSLQDARCQMAAALPDALVLDRGLPDGSGLDWLRQLRQERCTVPGLILSAQGEELDRVLGLELGADDYLAKPFSPRELVARVRALLRRSAIAPEPAAAQRTAVLADDLPGQRILLRGAALPLTRREYRLLSHLLGGVGRIYSRDQLLEAVWGDDSDSIDRTVDTHVKTLRAKLRAVDPAHEYIETHRGMGYSLKLPPVA